MSSCGGILEAGRLRHRITIERRDVVQDAYGQEQPTWSKVATVSAEIKPTRVIEGTTAEQRRSIATHTISCRWSKDLAGMDESHRVVFKTRIFNVIAVRDLYEVNASLVIEAQETR